jgi:hypothetical protein
MYLQVKIWFQNRRMKWKRSKKAAQEARQQKDDVNSDKNKSGDITGTLTSPSDADKTDTSLDTSGEKGNVDDDDDMSGENIDVTEIDEDDDDELAEMSEEDSAIDVTMGDGSGGGSVMAAPETELVQNLSAFPEVRSMVEPSHG